MAHRIFGALLRPIGDGEVDLGQHEMVDEVLGADTIECAARYVVSTYRLSPPAERVAVEPLPGLTDLLPEWRALIAQKPAGDRNRDWDTDEDRWMREVVQRMDGSDGLAKIARTTKRADDLRAWCRSLVDAGDWKAALPAFEEAAGIVADKDYARGELAAKLLAAESRLAGVTDQKRRRHYGHAAALVGVCVSCDPSTDTARWVAALRAEHKRFPALRAELDRAVGAP